MMYTCIVSLLDTTALFHFINKENCCIFLVVRWDLISAATLHTTGIPVKNHMMSCDANHMITCGKAYFINCSGHANDVVHWNV